MVWCMQRPPVTVVIPAWNAWATTRACLQSLRPTLAVHDQVVVVDNGSRDATAAQLRMMTWVDVVTNPDNRGFAGGCNDGAAAAHSDYLVFLNNDTLVHGHWLDALVQPLLDDPSLAATGPRSNMVSGPQQVDEAEYTTVAAMRTFARTWAHAHRGRSSPTDRLVGFCLAVRRSAFEQVEGFDESYGIGGYEDDDLCRRLRDAGYGLAISHESFVHHVGHRTFDANGLDWFAEQEANRERFHSASTRTDRRHPLVSACLIVKDEADNLPACLESLRDFVDEVVVYDTGSTDGTQEIARNLGATVLDGYWDDDFARARNAALEHCRGDWIAWLDADETLVCDDPTGLRQLLLATKTEIDAWSVPIDNLTGAGIGAGFIHHAARIFRRTRCEWTGRLHEQIARRTTHAGIHQAVLEAARIRHTGYLDEVMRARNKSERNLRVAEREAAEAEGQQRGFALTSLGRSYLIARRPEDAVPPSLQALEQTDNRVTRHLAMRTIVESLTLLGRLDEATLWVDRLRRDSTTPVMANFLEVPIALASGDPERALELLDTFGDSIADDDGFAYTAAMLAPMRAQALAACGRLGDAADTLLAVLTDNGVLDTHLGTVIDYLQQAGRPLSALSAAIPDDSQPMLLAQVLQLRPDIADATLDACWESGAHRLAVLATAATAARSLPIDRAIVWSARLREAGQAGPCPLVAIAGDPARDILTRTRSAAVSVGAFGDDRGRIALVRALGMADPQLRPAILAETAQLCPGLESGIPVSPANVRRPGGPAASIVIPCYNQAALTLQCLRSLGAATEPGSYEVILVDNGSTDATAAITDPDDPTFRVIRNATNLGFATASNQGAAAATAPIVVFLNNDTEAAPGWLSALLEPFARDDTIAVVGARLLYPDGTLQHAGVNLAINGVDGTLHGLHRLHHRPATDPRALEPCEPTAVTGAAMAVRRDIFNAAGAFHDGYWNGNEDVDLCLTIAEMGYKIVYEPGALLMHHESQSGPERFSKVHANIALLTERWGSRVRRDQLVPVP